MAGPTLEQDLFIREALRRDLIDYGPPGDHLHPPRAVTDLRIGGRLVPVQSLVEGTTVGTRAPTVRLWPWVMQLLANERRTVVSPRFTGPGLVDAIFIKVTSDANKTRIVGIELYYAEDGGGGGLAPSVTTTPTGTPIFIPFSQTTSGGFAVQAVGGVPTFFSMGTTVGYVDFTLNTLIALPNFFLKVSWAEESATGGQIEGYVRVVEGVDPADVGF